MIKWHLTLGSQHQQRLRLSVVSYLNTVPLIWGMTHGPQQGVFDLRYAVPSVCAEQLAGGETDIGIIPAVEMARQGLSYLPSAGIACRGPVRSILLISKVPAAEIRTLATDTGSRTSVMLARVILSRKYGVAPQFIPHAPHLPSMFDRADAALLIGDAALALKPEEIPFHVLDLGQEWMALTGLPMVFAVWSGREEVLARGGLDNIFLESCRFGLAHLDDIVESESVRLGFTRQLVREYFTRNVVLELGSEEHRGLQQFLQFAADLDEHIAPGRLVTC